MKNYLLIKEKSGIIAEIKRKSPSIGDINLNISVLNTSIGYTEVELKVAQFDDLSEDRFDFTRISGDARGYLPLGSRQRTLAARFFVSRDSAGAGSDVPFYYMQTLGGQDRLRGFRNFRFRDTNVLYMSAEYRWEAAAGIDLAVFYDTGKVFPDQDPFDFTKLRNTYGFGIRGKNMRRVVFRLDVGWSDEGTRLFITFGPSF